MNLLMDVGNTDIACGIYRGTVMVAKWRLRSQRRMTADELRWQLFGQLQMHQIAADGIRGVMVASVVPAIDGVVDQACSKLIAAPVAMVGEHGVRTGMAIDYLHPREVGADRLVNAIAARHVYGAPVIILDCGTATTFDIVTANGHYAGGLILPGVEMALESLAQRAARLPEVSLERTECLIGRDTVSAMQSGSYWGAVEAINGLIHRLHHELQDATVPVIATGGLAGVLSDDIKGLTAMEPNLTLDGLALLATEHFGASACK
ncbi:MAG: type III pantothenate kinase [Mariprofundales bacterium]|nr:type III pantothenate kinase [Mariprofundales bacterium]